MNNNLYYMCITKRRKQMYNESWKGKEIIMVFKQNAKNLESNKKLPFLFQN